MPNPVQQRREPAYPGSMRVDPDLGAIRFAAGEEPALTEQICAALDARQTCRRTIVWVARLDLTSPCGPLTLFYDEDGSRHLDLTLLDMAAREKVLARLQAAGL